MASTLPISDQSCTDMSIFIRQLRHLLELTQAQFAVKLGVATDSDRPLGKQSIKAFAKSSSCN